MIFSCVFCGQDHSFDPPAAETAGHQDSAQTGKDFSCVAFRDSFGIDPPDPDPDLVTEPGMMEGFRH